MFRTGGGARTVCARPGTRVGGGKGSAARTAARIVMLLTRNQVVEDMSDK
ncbi:hypothetical protein KPATCC21470_6493 [Kitasatospora purpeofusca]